MRTGTGLRDISPEWPVYRLNGSHDWGPTTECYQRLKVKALAIAQGAKKVVVVTADILYFAAEISDLIRARAAGLGLQRDEILLNASHSHCTPLLCALDALTPDKIDQRYWKYFVDRTVEAVADALAGLQPARLYAHEGSCDVAINKRLSAEFAPNPDGPVDRRVRLLVARSMDGALRSVLFLYGCHPSDVTDNAFGGDFFGFAQDELEARWPGVLMLAAQGMAGDTRVDHRDASGQSFVFSNRQSLDQTREYGRRLAAAVEAALAAKHTEIVGPIQSALQEISLPLDAPRSREKAQSMSASPSPFEARWGRFMLAQYDTKHPTFVTSLPYTIQSIRIGPGFVIVALDGEPFTEIGQSIERELRPDMVYVLGYSNSVAGYIAPAAEIPRGGFEIDVYYWWLVPAPFVGAIEAAVVDGAVDLVRGMQAAKADC